MTKKRGNDNIIVGIERKNINGAFISLDSKNKGSPGHLKRKESSKCNIRTQRK